MYMQYTEMLRERLVSWQEEDWKTRCELEALKNGKAFKSVPSTVRLNLLKINVHRFSIVLASFRELQ